MDSDKVDSQRRQERLRRRRQRECDARARENAEQREARFSRSRHTALGKVLGTKETRKSTHSSVDANRPAQRFRREAETPEAR